VLLHHAVQDRVGGSARDVVSHGARPSGLRAVVAVVPDDVRPAVTPASRRVRCNTIATRRFGCPSLGCSRPAMHAECWGLTIIRATMGARGLSETLKHDQPPRGWSRVGQGRTGTPVQPQEDDASISWYTGSWLFGVLVEFASGLSLHSDRPSRGLVGSTGAA
jgi:hypothetical protein